MSYNTIRRNGFESKFGRFYAVRQIIWKVEFFYAVDFDEDEFSRFGFRLMQKKLKEGKLDKLPDPIKKLRYDLHYEWLEGLTLGEIAKYPDWAMERFFLSESGQPDPTITTAPLGFPFDISSNYTSGNLRKAVDDIPGLHHATAFGSNQTIYVGWDKSAVEKAAKEHGAKQGEADMVKENKREAERAEKHKEYLDRLKLYGTEDCELDPTGRYMIDCEKIEGGWFDMGTENMTMLIRRGGGPGLYKATFDFGILKGMLVMGTDNVELDQYCAKLDRGLADYPCDSGDDEEDDDEYGGTDDSEDDERDDSENNEASDDDEDEEEDLTKPKIGSKRKASPENDKAHLSKRPKKTTDYFVRLRCRETGENQIYPDPEKGTLKFDRSNFSAFTLVLDLPCVGKDVIIKGRQICGLVGPTRVKWTDYSHAAYEYASVSRWK
ncbi:hypothetical protein V8F20_011144 [Naviculisporaceae sp. PSN 640]